MSDNRIFNVNGRLDKGGEELLLQTLELAFKQSFSKAVGYSISETYGFILYWTKSRNTILFPVALDANQVFTQVLAWLKSKPKCECVGWDANADHDGDNGPGWRVYCEDWGHIDSEWEAFLAIKPAFMWYGK